MPHSQVTFVGGLGPVLDSNAPVPTFIESNIITSLNDKTNCISNVSYPLPTIGSAGEIGKYLPLTDVTYKQTSKTI